MPWIVTKRKVGEEVWLVETSTVGTPYVVGVIQMRGPGTCEIALFVPPEVEVYRVREGRVQGSKAGSYGAGLVEKWAADRGSAEDRP